MKKFDPVQLSYFTGTEKYYRISRMHLVTDATIATEPATSIGVFDMSLSGSKSHT